MIRIANQVDQIKKAELGNLQVIAEGGFGKVYRLTEFRLPDDDTELAFKEFTKEPDAQVASAKAAVVFRTGLSPAERAELDKYTAWPRALVQEASGGICGVLMSLIPGAYFCERIDDQTAQMVSKPREMQWLIAPAVNRKEARIDLPDIDYTDRLFLMLQLVYIVGWLHKRQWVFGDLSFKNVIFALSPPRVMLVDCDGAAALSDSARKQYSSPFWDPPECPIKSSPGRYTVVQPALQDTVTDAYKLALAILRCLTPGRGASTSRNLSRFQGELNAEGLRLLDRALSKDRDGRPTAKELYQYLRQLTQPLVVIPEVHNAKLTTPFRLRGQDATVAWKLANATSLAILVGDTEKVSVDIGKHPNSFSFTPGQSGLVSIEVRNKYGSIRRDLGELTLYDLPEFSVDLNYLPRPQFPNIETVPLEPLAERIVNGSRLDVDVPGVPVIQPPQNLRLIDSLVPGQHAAIPGPRIDNTVIDASNNIIDLVLDEGGKYLAVLRQKYIDARTQEQSGGLNGESGQ